MTAVGQRHGRVGPHDADLVHAPAGPGAGQRRVARQPVSVKHIAWGAVIVARRIAEVERPDKDTAGAGPGDADLIFAIAVPVADDQLIAFLAENETRVAAVAARNVVPLIVAVVIQRPEQAMFAV